MCKALLSAAKRLLLLAALGPLSFTSMHAQNTYPEMWIEVERLESLAQPREAMALVDKIFLKAKQDKDLPQEIKAVIFRAKLSAAFEEDTYLRSVTYVSGLMAGAKGAEKALLGSVLAELRWRYMRENNYRISGRTALTEPGDNMEWWDLPAFSRRIGAEYLATLEESTLLQNIPVRDFTEVLDTGRGSELLRPTLFDLLAHRALEFLQSDDATFAYPAEVETLRAMDGLMQDARSFTALSISFKEGPLHAALYIYQQLLRFHSRGNDPLPLVDADLNRLELVRQRSGMEGADSLYIPALNELAIAWRQNPVYVDVVYGLAGEYLQRAASYNPPRDTLYRFDRRTAYTMMEEALNRFPAAFHAPHCRQLMKEIRQPAIELQLPNVFIPQQEALFLLQHSNLREVRVRVVGVEENEYREMLQSGQVGDIFSRLAAFPAIHDRIQVLDDGNDYQQHRVELALPRLPLGHYVLLVSDPAAADGKGASSFASFWVSGLAYATNQQDDGPLEVMVTSRSSGIPLSGAIVSVYYRYYDHRSRRYVVSPGPVATTDKEGIARLSSENQEGPNRQAHITLRYKDDYLSGEDYFYLWQRQAPRNKERPVCRIFTDRSVYRPGQTIWFKGIVYEKGDNAYRVKPETPLKLSFIDANGQQVAETSVTTNAWGSFHSSFTAPEGKLTGMHTIRSDYGMVSVMVEEYKRPRFEVLMDSLEGEYRLGDTVKVSGLAKGYAGNTIGMAGVKYKVVRSSWLPWTPWWDGWRIPWMDEQVQVASGSTTTAADGSFHLSFSAVSDRRFSAKYSPVHNYRVEVEITDITGEVRTGSTTVQLGKAALIIGVEMPERVSRSTGHSYTVTTRNLMGKEVGTVVEVDIIALPAPERLFRPRLWAGPDQWAYDKESFVKRFPLDPYADEAVGRYDDLVPMRTYTLDTRRETLLNLNALTYFPEGAYLLRFKARDRYGEEVMLEKRVELYDAKPGKDPFGIPLWAHINNAKAEPGDNLELILSSGAARMNVLIESFNTKGLRTREWVSLKGNKLVYPLKIDEADRGGIVLRYVAVHENRVYQGEFRVDVPRIGVALSAEFQSFRDRIEPGKPEEWRIIFRGDEGSQVLPEVLLGMYDASLDAIAPHSWAFSLPFPGPSARYWNSGHGFALGWGRSNVPQIPYPGRLPERGYDRLKWFGLDFWFGGGMLRYEREANDGIFMMSDDAGMAVPSAKRGAAENEAGNIREPEEAPVNEPPAEKESFIRRDLAETAFFMPQLRTDEQGNLSVNFTAPEALTRWNVLGLAHTKDMRLGNFSNSLITARDLMIIPNLPRHLYQGDQIILKARVANTGKDTLRGTASLEISDIISGKELHSLIQLQPIQDNFIILPGQGAEVAWKISIPEEGLPLLQILFSAKAGNKGDAEQHLLPVLSSRTLVTESRQLFVRGKESLQTKFDALENLAEKEPFKYSIEYTSNPSWYVVQALPYLMDDDRVSADAIFGRFFARSLGSLILEKNENIRGIFDVWSQYQPEALFSALEKNQDLKSVVLEETPWVREARNEKASKQALGNYFNQSNLTNGLQNEWDALQRLQTPDGAWPWFPGMRVSRHITTEILSGMGYLAATGALEMSSAQVNVAVNAARFLLREWAHDKREIERAGKDLLKTYVPGNHQVYELYAISPWLGEFEPTVEMDEAWKYFLERAEASWTTYPIQVQALLGTATLAQDRSKLAVAIMASFNDRALRDADGAMYWRDIRSGFAWYDSPEGSMARMIEFYHASGSAQETIDAMRTWLLRRKQVTHWQGSKATAMAVQAFLTRGSEWLKPEGEVKLSVGGITLPDADPALRVEAGSGHFRKDWQASEITPVLADISVVSTSSVPSWGAAYFQYFAEMKDVLPQSEGLGLNKVWARVDNIGGKEMLTPVEKQMLKPGDRLRVRMEITTERDLDYVHLKDPRPALLEPVDKTSGYRWNGGLGWYLSIRDVATHFYFERLPKGKHVLEYDMFVSQEGAFSAGPASIQCLYAPEYGAHTGGTQWRSASGR
jgi:hypothetical protein